jgi:hypothetical protein
MNRFPWTPIVLSLAMLLIAAPGTAIEWDGPAVDDEAGSLEGELEAGDRVHVVFDRESVPDHVGDPTSWEQRIGTLESYRDGVLVFTPEHSDGSPISVPLDQIRSLDVDHGKPDHTTEGMLIGLAVGLGVAIATQSGPSECEGFMCEMDESATRVGTGVAITLVGMLFGAGIGSTISTEDWQRVYDKHDTGAARGRRFRECEVAFGIRF